MVASEGAWSAGVTFLSVVIAGLLAMNFFEPVALLLSNSLPAYDSKMDMVALLGIFSMAVFLLRLAGERMAPVYIQVHALVEQAGRWGFGLATGYVTMAILLTALHTAPVPREFYGFTPERNNFLGVAAPDRQWLAFTQYVTEHAFARYDLSLVSGAPLKTPHGFDAPYHVLEPATGVATNTIWPSFPIRYAMRREQFGAGGMAIPAAPAVPVGGGNAPVVAPRPAGGGGSVGF